MVMDAKDFGAWVRGLRDAEGKSREVICREAGISTSTLANIEKGGRYIGGHWNVEHAHPDTLVVLARVLRVPEAEMVRIAPTRARPERQDGMATEVDLSEGMRLSDVNVSELLRRLDGLTLEVARLVAVLA